MGQSIDFSKAYDKLDGEQYRSAVTSTVPSIEESCNEFVPILKGDLRGSSSVHGDSITWSAPYARRAYYTYKNGSFWDRLASRAHAEAWAQEIADKMTTD